MPRTRVKNKGLPRRVYIKHGAYRFLATPKIVDPSDGKLKSWIKLSNISEGESVMYAALAKLLDDSVLNQESMSYLCEEYVKHKLHEYSKETQDQYKSFCKKIAANFAEFNVDQVTTKDCADFLRHNFKATDKAKNNTAKKYAALLRKIFIFAISELGLRQDNPIDNLDTSHYKTGRREVLATHEQIAAIRAAGFIGRDGKKTHSGEMFACIIDMSYLCWQRAIDIRLLKESQISNGYITFKPSKTSKTSGKQVDIYITAEIQAVIEKAREIKRKYSIISEYLFSKDDCQPYAKSGLSTMWKRAKERSGIKEDVIFKDIRALGATDAAKRGEDRADIQKRLAHTSAKTTEIYIKEVIPDKSNLKSKLPWGPD
jgi:integrase